MLNANFILLFLLTCSTIIALINSAGFVIYLCLPSGYCQVVAIRTFVATAILNKIKDIDSKSDVAIGTLIIIIYTTLVKWHDLTKQINQLILSLATTIIILTTYIIILTVNFVHDLLNVTMA